MNNLDLSLRAKRHFLRVVQRHLADRITRASNMTTYVFKGLSKWSKEGLDLADSGFCELHSKESIFEKDKKKYNLSSETFKLYTENLIEKVERIHAMEQCLVDMPSNVKGYVLKKYSSITDAMMNTKRKRNLARPSTCINCRPKDC